MSVEEYLRCRDEGIPFEEEKPLDRDELAHLVVFATAALHDAETIQELAAKLQEAAMALYWENTGGTLGTVRDSLVEWAQNIHASSEKGGDDA